ncbi:MAG: transcriptional repressor [Rhodobacterales bacterium]|nr:transcriptional repressor [Rhodobacterales bacterium]
MNAETDSPLGFNRHDHKGCVRAALLAAEQTCAGQNLQFTATRRRVLEILLEHHTAIGAYEVLDRLNAEGVGAKPPIAYRALGFLVDNGFAHRIEKLNAFVACAHPGIVHDPAFLICRKCHSVGEQTTCSGLIERATKAGFAAEHTIAEVVGLCANCQFEKETGK